MSELDKRADKLADEFGRHPLLALAKWGAGVVAVVVVLVALVGLVSTGSVFFQGAAAKLTAAPRVEQRVYDPTNIVNQVYFFTTTCEDVGRDYANWRSNQGDYERESTLARQARTQGELTEYQQSAQQYVTAVSGALQQLQQDAADYNARSLNYTANPFKSAGLPYRITPPAVSAELVNWTPPACG